MNVDLKIDHGANILCVFDSLHFSKFFTVRRYTLLLDIDNFHCHIARWRSRSFSLTHVQLSSVTLKKVDAIHKSAVLLSDCSFGTGKKATSDRTEKHHTQGMKNVRLAWNLFLILKCAD